MVQTHQYRQSPLPQNKGLDEYEQIHQSQLRMVHIVRRYSYTYDYSPAGHSGRGTDDWVPVDLHSPTRPLDPSPLAPLDATSLPDDITCLIRRRYIYSSRAPLVLSAHHHASTNTTSPPRYRSLPSSTRRDLTINHVSRVSPNSNSADVTSAKQRHGSYLIPAHPALPLPQLPPLLLPVPPTTLACREAGPDDRDEARVAEAGSQVRQCQEDGWPTTGHVYDRTMQTRKRAADEEDEEVVSGCKKTKSSPVGSTASSEPRRQRPRKRPSNAADDDITMDSSSALGDRDHTPSISAFTYTHAGPSAPPPRKPKMPAQLLVAQMRKRQARANPLSAKPAKDDYLKIEIKWLSDRLQYESEQNGIKDAEIERITRLLNRALMERDLSAGQVLALRSRLAGLRRSASDEVRQIGVEVSRMAKERAEWFAQMAKHKTQMADMERQAADLRKANLLLFTQLSKKEREKGKGREYVQMVQDRREFTNRPSVPRTSARLADRKVLPEPVPERTPAPEYAESSQASPRLQRLGNHFFTTQRELTPPPSVSPDPCAFARTTFAAPASPDDTPPASPTPRRARSPTPPMDDPADLARRNARASLAPRLRPVRRDPPQYREFVPPPGYDEDSANLAAGSFSQLSIGAVSGDLDTAILEETPRTMPGYMAPYNIPPQPRRSQRLAHERTAREDTPLRQCVQEGVFFAGLGAAVVSTFLH